MKALFRLGVGGLVAGLLALFLLPFLVAAVVAARLQEAAQTAASWDVPAEVVPALQEAGQRSGLPWFLLAGVASVATDFGRHGPDGVVRGGTGGTAIFPVVTPPIVRPGPGEGMFLVAASAASGLTDPQDVPTEAGWIADRLAAAAGGDPIAGHRLGEPGADPFWRRLLGAVPLAISMPAPSDELAPAEPGDDPIRRFGRAVLAQIAAPVTATNLGAFAAWAAGEGTCARFNPLATTQPEPGATPFNNLPSGGHVWNYPSLAVGVKATTTGLTNGRYQPVLDAFRADAGVAAVADAVEHSPWGTRRFGSPTYAGRQCGNDPTGTGAASVPPILTGPDAIAAAIVARAVQYQAIWSEMEALAPAGAAATTP